MVCVLAEAVATKATYVSPNARWIFTVTPMTKWIWTGAIALAVVVFVIWQRSGTKTAYVNGLPEYTNLPGKEYIFQRDCYVFKLNRQDTSYPLVGAHAPDAAIHVPELPREISEKNIGFKDEKVRILDVVRAGTRFRIVSVRREQTRRATTITFEILLSDEAERRYPRLDAFYILDHAPEKEGKAPIIVPDYAVERVKK
jgi:hypothetical protein